MAQGSRKRFWGAAVAMVCAAIALWRVAPRVVWNQRPVRQLGVVILDKTVPFTVYREHDTFTWLLRALRIQSGGRYLDPTRDFIGHDPHTRTGRLLQPGDLADADLLFVADTYGVYADDYARPGNVAHMERSSRLFGGIEPAEADAIAAFAQRGGTVIGEFNTFASPTEGRARDTLERLFGVRWTGWVGRFWPRLEDPTEVPRWVGEVYQRVTGKPFDFQGPGFVFVREDSDMVVLRPKVHIEPHLLSLVRTAEAPDLDGLPSGGTFRYWLDVLEPRDCDVIYQHELAITEEGARELEAHGLPRAFPALVRRRGGVRAMYFAGDFVDTTATRGDPDQAGVLTYRRWVGTPDNPDQALFWTWYAPLMERLLADVPRVERDGERGVERGVER